MSVDNEVRKAAHYPTKGVGVASGKAGGWWWWWWLVGTGILCGSCGDEYPLAPSFCDEFCRATLRGGCAREPEDCVRSCEQQGIGPDCKSAETELLSCYEDAPDDAFVCWGSTSGVRVRDGVCLAERDALLLCELPNIGSCLDVCRPYQAALDGRLGGDLGGADAAVTEQCLLLRQSCEELCWNLLTIGVPEVTYPDDSPQATPVSVEAPLAADAGTAPPFEGIRQLLPGCGF